MFLGSLLSLSVLISSCSPGYLLFYSLDIEAYEPFIPQYAFIPSPITANEKIYIFKIFAQVLVTLRRLRVVREENPPPAR